MALTPDYSIGIVLVDGTDPDWPDNKEHSFHVNGGKVTELYGWGRHGSTRADQHIHPNGPQAENYTTVYLTGGLTKQAEKVIPGIIAEHREKFANSVVWTVPQVGALAAWVRNGMGHGPGEVEVEEDEEVDPVAADSAAGADLWDTAGDPDDVPPADEVEAEVEAGEAGEDGDEEE